jgi:hypothetical protein
MNGRIAGKKREIEDDEMSGLLSAPADIGIGLKNKINNRVNRILLAKDAIAWTVEDKIQLKKIFSE